MLFLVLLFKKNGCAKQIPPSLNQIHFKNFRLQTNTNNLYPQPQKNGRFLGGVTFFLRGLILSQDFFIQLEYTLGLAGQQAWPVDRLYLSNRYYWALNFNFLDFQYFQGPFCPQFWPYPTYATKMNFLSTIASYTF